ncbi:sigma D regulator [Marinomonas mediterranea]|jgi:Regulator of sigma D|uniref:Regulator of RpoD, Rsd/AlgQ n=1 Tax=Marinomonas mediterranea (strain ATCC 700492 / JCM 21426 / NBRC 103028 / MMB-1) TaxID=717774 RepID=F2K148_MARM1|nr:sigma D regulator [Marinomonas mediterranea]ADZ89898.1 regulator of RpoD, Rsd/AlgQ [Marinomonas mediterranea MMB-1]WCN07983.1 sigma D regulator [Marinomonas mediterranea]WCN12078.1 sigma D regulator [Marinomonas mediterranea]WCN16116.1 sigma D regulator [Marinomonas mediterranea MMB-1]
MLERCKSAQERWGGVHEIIDRWLLQRRQLIEALVTIKGLGEYTPTDTPKIQRLCEMLVDYVSVGHFGVYEQLALEAKDFNDTGALALFKKLMPEIESTTEVAIEFNDKYDTKEHCNAQLEELPFSIQTVSVVMAERFGFEDQLIERLHHAHSEKTA